MAARTTTKDGTFSNSDGDCLDGGTPLGTTDTLTISHNASLSGDTTCGSSPSTGGTAAIAFGSVTGKTLAIGAYRLIAKGDIHGTSSYMGTNSVTGSAGGRLTFLPPSGQQYGFIGVASSGLHVNLTGNSGSHFTLDTDKSSSGLSSITSASAAFGKRIYFTLDYVDVTDFGTASDFGVSNRVHGAVSFGVTNCTFTRSSYYLSTVNSPSDYSGAYAFSGNRFSSSVNVTAGATRSVEFSFYTAGVAGGATISGNSFDKDIRFSDFVPGVIFTGNYLANATFAATSTWTDETHFANNFFAETNDTLLYGPSSANYFANAQTDNPHFIANVGADADLIENAIFEATGNTGVVSDYGDCISGGANNVTVRGCISLPTYSESGAFYGAGRFLSLAGLSTGNFTIEHNTCFIGSAYSETGNNSAGDIASFKSNLIWHDSAGMQKLVNNGSGPTDIVDPANVVKNAGWNTSATQNGYEGDWSVVPGSTDVTISSDPFVDKTRCLATWAASKGQATTAAAAKALIAANPSLITEADTGLIAWVRAGFKVTGSQGLLLQDAGHDDETIGAMGYVAASSGSTGMGSARGHRLLRP